MRELKQNIILLGCSLGGSWCMFFDKNENHEYNKYFDTDVRYNIKNYTQGAGSNQVALHVLHNEYLRDPNTLLDNTSIIVELTDFSRRNMVIFDKEKTLKRNKQILNPNYILQDALNVGSHMIKNSITDNVEYIVPESRGANDLLDANLFPTDYIRENSSRYTQEWMNMYLISTMCLIANIGSEVDIRVFRGWDTIMSPSAWYNTKNYLSKNNILFSDLSYIETCASFSKSDEDWIDEFHPKYRFLGHPAMCRIMSTMS